MAQRLDVSSTIRFGMPHHQPIGIDLFAAPALRTDWPRSSESRSCSLVPYRLEQCQCRLASARALQSHVDGARLELLQGGDVAIGPHHYGERLSMGGKRVLSSGWGLPGKGSCALAGLIEPVGLDEGVKRSPVCSMRRFWDGTELAGVCIDNVGSLLLASRQNSLMTW